MFIPGFNMGFFINPTFEGNSLKEENHNTSQKTNNNRYLSCPVTPDYNKIDNNKSLNQKNYELFEKKTLFTENFKKKFENYNMINVLDKFANNLFLEDNIMKMKKENLEKLEFLTEEEKEKVNLLLNEIRGVSNV